MSLTVTADDLERSLSAYHAESRLMVVPTPRFRCRVHAWGEGPPLVLIHGMSDVPISFCMIARELKKSFSCYLLELASGDQDGCRYRAYRHPHHVDDLLATFDFLKLDRPHVMGSSFGSTVSLRFAATYPARISKLVLQGGFAYRPLNRFEKGLAQLARYWPGKMSDLKIRRKVMEKFDRPQFATADESVYRFFLACSGETPIQCAARRSLMLHTNDLRPLLPTIATPTLMIGGDRDGLVPRHCEADVEQNLPDVRRVEYSNCGHYPQYTHPNEMAKDMTAFLESPISPSRSFPTMPYSSPPKLPDNGNVKNT